MLALGVNLKGNSKKKRQKMYTPKCLSGAIHIPCILQGTDTAHYYATGEGLGGRGFRKHKGKCARFNTKQKEKKGYKINIQHVLAVIRCIENNTRILTFCFSPEWDYGKFFLFEFSIVRLQYFYVWGEVCVRVLKLRHKKSHLTCR